MTNNEMHLYDQLCEREIATPEELNLVRSLVSGTWEEILNSVLFVRTGYRSLQQMVDAEDEEDLYANLTIENVEEYRVFIASHLA